MSRQSTIKDILKSRIPDMTDEELNAVSMNIAMNEDKHKKKFKKTFRNDEIVRKGRNRHANTTAKLSAAKAAKSAHNSKLYQQKKMELAEEFGRKINSGEIRMSTPGVLTGTNFKKGQAYYNSRRSIHPYELASEELRRLVKEDPAKYEYAINILFRGIEADILHDKAKESGKGGGAGFNMAAAPAPAPARAPKSLAKNIPAPPKSASAPKFSFNNNSLEVENVVIRKPAAPAPAPAPAPVVAPIVATNWTNEDEFSMPVILTKKGGSKRSGSKRRKTKARKSRRRTHK